METPLAVSDFLRNSSILLGKPLGTPCYPLHLFGKGYWTSGWQGIVGFSQGYQKGVSARHYTIIYKGLHYPRVAGYGRVVSWGIRWGICHDL